MLKSMTGYGRNRQILDRWDITAEVRSVNNRYLDCNIKLPRAFLFAEDRVRALVKRYVARGKTDIFFTVSSQGAEETAVSVNEVLAEGYLAAFRQLGELAGVEEQGRFQAMLPELLARQPNVLTASSVEMDVETVTACLLTVLEQALVNHSAMRETEGERLKADLLSKLEGLEGLLSQVEVRSPQTVADYRNRLTEKLREVLEGCQLDESRILTEAAIFADKIAVDEETVRLRSHIAQFRTLMEADEPVGRRLDFLLQEMNRETNTIGSKCADLDISQVVVDMKAELEKIREQVQNLE